MLPRHRLNMALGVGCVVWERPSGGNCDLSDGERNPFCWVETLESGLRMMSLGLADVPASGDRSCPGALMDVVVGASLCSGVAVAAPATTAGGESGVQRGRRRHPSGGSRVLRQ